MAGGISKLDLSVPAKTPMMKNMMAGSNKLCMVESFVEILTSSIDVVKLIIQYKYIDKNL
jgi:hypothetical protein